MKALYKNPIAIILTILSIGGFIFFEDQLPSIDLSNLEPGNVIAMLGYISVVMLVVEQCIEVFIDDPNQRIKRECKDRIAEIDQQMETIRAPIRSAVTNEESTEPMIETNEVAKMMKEKKELEDILMVRGKRRQRRTTLVAFIIGLVLSFSGIRLISGIIFNGPQETLSEIQFTIIQSIDVILTAGIIAGGSGRMHRLLKRVKEALGQY